ncbi:mucin TcMUCII [Trypanosoma cruzi cruzi]|uniref:Putative mucin TcMUCII n=1 Tax=Trypanosoma cruzi TaxID=5693 RepID=A0A2V2VRI8_TRYCR|nr:mucin TcMUCII [Trypanosoma cruzi cruzi]PWU98764.1 putative mucin TcMUCII [Trypanosoma cruzi]
MMTTCRLLCALLVLTLCCCPSVCVTDIVGHTDTETDITPKEKVNKGTVTAVSSSTPTKPGPAAPADTTEEVSEEEPGSLRSPDSIIVGQVESNADMEIKPNTTTTTTTTKAPTINTTTTTTTTTTAPEAPSTKTTTTTTTTRAPSRLREVDGSLSSPAWVCVPLLLAVSALACTAVG